MTRSDMHDESCPKCGRSLASAVAIKRIDTSAPDDSRLTRTWKVVQCVCGEQIRRLWQSST